MSKDGSAGGPDAAGVSWCGPAELLRKAEKSQPPAIAGISLVILAVGPAQAGPEPARDTGTPSTG